MQRLIDYPQVNPIQMLPQRPIPPTGFVETNHYKHYNEWWFTEQLKEWQGLNSFYYQKLQQNNRLTVQWHANNNSEDALVEIVSQCGEVVYSIDAIATGVTGKEIISQVDGQSYTGYTFSISPIISSFGLDDGIYYVLLKTKFHDPTDPNADAFGMVYEVMISEPISILEEHPKTINIKYRNSTNDFDVFFKSPFNLTFELRVESWMYGLTAHSIDTTFEDEQVDLVQVQSVPYNTYTFTIRRVPEWMQNKVNRAFSCDMVRLGHETKYFTKDKDAKWEANFNTNRPLHAYSIQVREAKNYYSQQSQTITPLVVWEILNNGDSGNSTRFPYFVWSARINRSGASNVVLMTEIDGADGPFPYTTYCREVRNATHEQELLDHANNVTRVMYGQTGYYGTVTTSSGGLKFVYYPGSGETNITGKLSYILSQHILVKFEGGAYGTGQYYDVKGSRIGYGFIRQNNTHLSAAYGNGNPTLTHLVGGSSVNLIGNEARVYHYDQQGSADTVTIFSAHYSAQTPNITDVSVTLPATLFAFRVTSGVYYNNLDWQWLAPCASTLFSVNVRGNAIDTVTNMDTYLGTLQLTAFQYYDLSDNALGSAMVDSVFNQMYNTGGGQETFTLTNGEMYTDAQTPAAPPTGASATARNFIDVTKSWIVATD